MRDLIVMAWTILFPAGGLVIAALAILLHYQTKKNLAQGSSAKHLQELREDIAILRRQMEALQETLADMTLMLHEPLQRALPSKDALVAEPKQEGETR